MRGYPPCSQHFSWGLFKMVKTANCELPCYEKIIAALLKGGYVWRADEG